MRHLDRLMHHPTYESAPGYWRRHEAAIANPTPSERPIVSMLHGWLAYADAHRARYDSGIGDDGVLGPEWRRIGDALRGLLNGECGRLDCGAVDSIIAEAMRAEGFDPDE